MYEEGILMSKFNLTEKEKELLKYAYIDNDRIDEGNLFDYQEAALHMIRKSSVYLEVRYPNHDLEMISFLPQTKKTSYSEIHFVESGSDVTYTLRCQTKNGEDTFSDNFYDVPFEKEYDKRVERLLKARKISSRVYTVFPFLISNRIDSLEDLLNMERLSRNTEVFIGVDEFPSEEEMQDTCSKIEDIFKQNKLYGSCVVYFMLDIEDMNRDISYFDEYVKDRKNQKNIVSIAFYTK